MTDEQDRIRLSPDTIRRERPILFSGPMVRAILDGRKTQTRRVCKVQPKGSNYLRAAGEAYGDGFGYGPFAESTYWSNVVQNIECPFGQPGDRLWVRETWAHDGPDLATVRAAHEDAMPGKTYGPYYRVGEVAPDTLRWRPSIHMPRWASRITLEVTGVRVERLQDISESDAVDEGSFCNGRYKEEPPPSYPRATFKDLWNSINAKRGHGWDTNPWVWVIEFKFDKDNPGILK